MRVYTLQTAPLSSYEEDNLSKDVVDRNYSPTNHNYSQRLIKRVQRVHL